MTYERPFDWSRGVSKESVLRRELVGVKAQRDELLAALVEYLAAGENSVNPPNDDHIAAMLRFGEAEEAARAAIAKVKGQP